MLLKPENLVVVDGDGDEAQSLLAEAEHESLSSMAPIWREAIALAHLELTQILLHHHQPRTRTIDRTLYYRERIVLVVVVDLI